MEVGKNELLTARKVLVTTLIASSTLLGIKTYLYILTGSITVLAYMMDSLYDFINDAVSVWAINRALEPPDKDHPYGHENLRPKHDYS
ncbi:MAG: cation transporter [Candidatus Njordarchaeales archaeon]